MERERVVGWGQMFVLFFMLAVSFFVAAKQANGSQIARDEPSLCRACCN